jgi:hypothetical protein
MYWSQRWRNFGIFFAYVHRLSCANDLRYIIFNAFAIFILFYYTRIAKLERKKSTQPNPAVKVKEFAATVGKGVENLLVRKDQAEDDNRGADLSMNTANFAIFQGAGLETLDSRGLGRQWTRRDENTD